MELKVELTSAEEIQAGVVFLRELSLLRYKKTTTEVIVEMKGRAEDAAPAPAAEAPEAPAPEAKKRGRPPKAQAEPAPADTSREPPATVEEVRTALQSVVDHDKLGMPVAEKIIKDAGGEKISTLTPAQRTEVVAACKAAVQGAK